MSDQPQMSILDHKLKNVIEFRLPSDPKILKVVRLTTAYIAEMVGFDQNEQNSIKLAVDEACANIIKHAYENRYDGPITVTCRMLTNGIEIVLNDFGKKVKKGEIQSRDLDDVRPGGLGVHLIESIMDEVIYEDAGDEGNNLKLRKYKTDKERS